MPGAKMGEAGIWFYHAPARKDHTATKKEYPLVSQLPELNGAYIDSDEILREEREKNKVGWFKESDSNFMRMVKGGGRHDLLYHREPRTSVKTAQPVGYEKCQWFYEDENMMDATAKRMADSEGYQFTQPAWMVHKAWQGSKGGATRVGNPYAGDRQSAFERTPNPTDKTVKIENILPEGYGRRLMNQRCQPIDGAKHGKSCKPIKIRSKPKLRPVEARTLSVPTSSDPSYVPKMAQVNPHQSTYMSKLMEHGYQRDWERQRDSLYNQEQTA